MTSTSYTLSAGNKGYHANDSANNISFGHQPEWESQTMEESHTAKVSELITHLVHVMHVL